MSGHGPNSWAGSWSPDNIDGSVGGFRAVNRKIFYQNPAALVGAGQLYYDRYYNYAAFSGVASAKTHIGIIDWSPEKFAASGTLAGDAQLSHPAGAVNNWPGSGQFAGEADFLSVAAVALPTSGSFAATGELDGIFYQAYGATQAAFSAVGSFAVVYSSAVAAAGAFASSSVFIGTAVLAVHQWSGEANYSAAGAFSGDAQQIHLYQGTGSYSAIGALSGDAAAVHIWQGAGNYLGSGTLSGSTVANISVATGFSGGAALGESDWLQAVTSGLFGGVGSVNAVALEPPAPPVQASFAADSVFIGTAVLAAHQWQASGELWATGALTGDAVQVHIWQATGNYSAGGGLRGVLTEPSVKASFSGAADLGSTDLLAAAISGSFATNGSLHAVATPYPLTWWDPANNSSATLSNHDLTASFQSAASVWASVKSTPSKINGKLYFEDTCVASDGTGWIIGFGNASASLYSYAGDAGSIGWQKLATGIAKWPGNISYSSLSITDGDIVGIAIDLDARLAWFRNVSTGSGWTDAAGGLTGNPATGAGGTSFAFAGPIYIMASGYYGGAPDTHTLNTAPSTQPPAGFVTWDAAPPQTWPASARFDGTGNISVLLREIYATNPVVFSAVASVSSAVVLTIPAVQSFLAVGVLAPTSTLYLPATGSMFATSQFSARYVAKLAASAIFSGGSSITARFFGNVVASASFHGVDDALHASLFSRVGAPQHWDDVHINANISGGGTIGPLIMNGNQIYAPAYGNEGFNAGKKYWEISITDNFNGGVGIGTTSSSSDDGQWLGASSDTLGVYFSQSGSSAQLWVNGVTQAQYTVSWSYGDLLAIAADFDNNLLWVRDVTANSAWYGSDVGDPASGTNGFSINQGGFTIINAPIVPAVSLYNNQDTAVAGFAPVTWSGVPPVGFDAFDYKFTWGSFQAVAEFSGTAVAVHEVQASGGFIGTASYSAAVSQVWHSTSATFTATGAFSGFDYAVFVDSAAFPAAGSLVVYETVIHADPRFIYAGFSGSSATQLHIGIIDHASHQFAAASTLRGDTFQLHPGPNSWPISASVAATGTLAEIVWLIGAESAGFSGGSGFSMPKPVLELIVTPPAPSLINPQLGDHVAYLNGQRWDGRAFDGNFIFAPPYWDYPNAGTVGGCGAGVFAIVQPDGPGTQGELIINPAGPGVGTLSGPITDYATIEAADPAVSQLEGFAGGASLGATATVLSYGGSSYFVYANFVGTASLAATSTLKTLISASFGASATLVGVAGIVGRISAACSAVGSLAATANTTLPASAAFVATDAALVGMANLAQAGNAIFAGAGNVSGSISRAWLAAASAFSGYAEIDAKLVQRYYTNLAAFAGNAEIDGQTAQWYSTNPAGFSAAGGVGATAVVSGNFIEASFINDSWFFARENALLLSAATFSADSTFVATAAVNVRGFAAFRAEADFTGSASATLPAAASFAGLAVHSAQISSLISSGSARFVAQGSSHVEATRTIASSASFSGAGTVSALPSVVGFISASFSVSSEAGAETLVPISGQYWSASGSFGALDVGAFAGDSAVQHWLGVEYAFAGAGSLSAVATVIYGSSLRAGFAGAGRVSGRLYPILDLIDIGLTQTSPRSVHSFIYTGINVTIEQQETGVLILALEFDPLPPPADLRNIAYESLNIPVPTFDGVTAIWDYGGTNQVMTRVPSLPSPAVPSPPGLGDFTIAFTLQNPEPGVQELLISWTEPSAQVSAYAVTYGHGVPAGPAPLAAEFAETDFHVNVGRFLNRRRVLVE